MDSDWSAVIRSEAAGVWRDLRSPRAGGAGVTLVVLGAGLAAITAPEFDPARSLRAAALLFVPISALLQVVAFADLRRRVRLGTGLEAGAGAPNAVVKTVRSVLARTLALVVVASAGMILIWLPWVLRASIWPGVFAWELIVSTWMVAVGVTGIAIRFSLDVVGRAETGAGGWARGTRLGVLAAAAAYATGLWLRGPGGEAGLLATNLILSGALLALSFNRLAQYGPQALRKL